MSRKLVCIADAHVHPWRLQSRDGGHDRLMDGLSVINQSLELAKNLDAVWVFAGDMKQPKTFWPQQALTGLHSIFRHYRRDVQMVMIAGNHDAMGEGGSGLAPFSDCARIVDTPESVDIGGITLVCCPWNGKPSEVADLLETDKVLKGPRILIAHGFLQGCMLGPEDTRIAKGIPIGDYGKFDLAIFGDVHKAQIRVPEAIEKGRPATWVEFPADGTLLPTGSVVYCGSPYQQNWGERNDPKKGALVIDLDTQKAEMVYLTAPRYRHFDLHYETAVPFLEQLDAFDTGDFVRIVYEGALGQVTDKLREWGQTQRSFQFIQRKPTSVTQRIQVHAGMSKRELLVNYALARPLSDADPKVVLDALIRLGGVND